MTQLTNPESWPDRVLAWQEALDRKWKARLEKGFLRLTQVLTWSYLGLVIVVWLLLHLTGDLWWPTTLLLFGPRWLGLLPLGLLVPLAVVMRPRMLWILAATTVLFVLGVMGYCLRWPGQAWFAGSGPTVTVVTYNVHDGEEHADAFAALLYREVPDIVALQEVPGDATLPFPEDWHVVREGQLVIASPFVIRDVQTSLQSDRPLPRPPLIAIHAVVECPDVPVAICNVHLASPQAGISETLDRHTLVSVSRSESLQQLIDRRWRESEKIAAWIEGFPRTDLVLGDFNMPVESRIYRKYWSGYRNAFSDIGLGVGYTRWVELHNFQYGARIDHVLTGDDWRSVNCHVGRHVGSDHVPLVARISWAGHGRESQLADRSRP